MRKLFPKSNFPDLLTLGDSVELEILQMPYSYLWFSSALHMGLPSARGTDKHTKELQSPIGVCGVEKYRGLRPAVGI